MPCRETPEELAWAAATALDHLRQSVTAYEQERASALALLHELLAGSRLSQETVRTVLALVESPVAANGPAEDERTIVERRLRQAEIAVCILRSTLIQVLPLLPPATLALHAKRIATLRIDHLHHREQDRAAALATIARRVESLSGNASGSADLAHATAEMTRLQHLTPEELLGTGEFRSPTPCPLCGAPLPTPPGLEPAQMEVLAAWIATGNRLDAIKCIGKATGLRLGECHQFITCPHRVTPRADGDEAGDISPYICRTCHQPLPTFAGLTRDLAKRMRSWLVADKPRAGLVTLVQDATGWDLNQTRRYLECPHRLPKPDRMKQSGTRDE